jgi:hypothetical protein
MTLPLTQNRFDLLDVDRSIITRGSVVSRPEVRKENIADSSNGFIIRSSLKLVMIRDLQCRFIRLLEHQNVRTIEVHRDLGNSFEHVRDFERDPRTELREFKDALADIRKAWTDFFDPYYEFFRLWKPALVCFDSLHRLLPSKVPTLVTSGPSAANGTRFEVCGHPMKFRPIGCSGFLAEIARRSGVVTTPIGEQPATKFESVEVEIVQRDVKWIEVSGKEEMRSEFLNGGKWRVISTHVHTLQSVVREEGDDSSPLEVLDPNQSRLLHKFSSEIFVSRIGV